MPFVIYHYPCADGVMAALAAHLAHPNSTFFPLTNWAKPAEKEAIVAAIPATDTVYLLDITGGADLVRALCARAASVVLLDHHKAAFELLEELGAGGAALPANLVSHCALEIGRAHV